MNATTTMHLDEALAPPDTQICAEIVCTARAQTRERTLARRVTRSNNARIKGKPAELYNATCRPRYRAWTNQNLRPISTSSRFPRDCKHFSRFADDVRFLASNIATTVLRWIPTFRIIYIRIRYFGTYRSEKTTSEYGRQNTRHRG